MIHSMTGFGGATAKSRYGLINVEIRTLNHKFFELSIKLPNGLADFEDRIKKLLQEKIKRGKIYLNVNLEETIKNTDRISIDKDLARAYCRQLLQLKRILDIKGDIKLEQFIALPGVISYETPKIDSAKIWSYAKRAFDKALACLIKDREKEGAVLYNDLFKRIKSINSLLSHIDERSNITINSYKTHLAKKIKELTGSQPMDKGRIEQEVAIFAKNCDISEELTRMKSHLITFEESIKSDQEAGKKLDFIAQELNREINTMSAKASDFKISKWVIHIKGEIEKIREQVKNVE